MTYSARREVPRHVDDQPTISSYCTTGGCVGVRFAPDGVDVVDTKGGAPALRFDREEWAAFVAGVKNGEFDLT